MDITRTKSDETFRSEDLRPAARTIAVTASLVVLVHTIVMIVDGAAHMHLNIELGPLAKAYVLGIVGIGPIIGLVFLKSRRQRMGAVILFLTMMGGLLFGFWNHFIEPGADHVMHLQAGPWKLPFQASAGLLSVSEAAGAVIGLVMLTGINTKMKADVRE